LDLQSERSGSACAATAFTAQSVAAFRSHFISAWGAETANHVARELFVVKMKRFPSRILRGAHAFSSLSAEGQTDLEELPSA